MNTEYRKRLPGTDLDYFDTRAAVDAIQPGAYDTLPYTSRILAEQLHNEVGARTVASDLYEPRHRAAVLQPFEHLLLVQ